MKWLKGSSALCFASPKSHIEKRAYPEVEINTQSCAEQRNTCEVSFERVVSGGVSKCVCHSTAALEICTSKGYLAIANLNWLVVLISCSFSPWGWLVDEYFSEGFNHQAVDGDSRVPSKAFTGPPKAAEDKMLFLAIVTHEALGAI